MLFVKSNDSFSGESLKIIFNEMYLFIEHLAFRLILNKTIQKNMVATFQTYFRRLFLMVVLWNKWKKLLDTIWKLYSISNLYSKAWSRFCNEHLSVGRFFGRRIVVDIFILTMAEQGDGRGVKIVWKISREGEIWVKSSPPWLAQRHNHHVPTPQISVEIRRI